MQGFDGIREHNVGVRTAVLNLLSYEDLYRPIFGVYCSSVLLFLVNAVESSEEELDNVSIWRRVCSSKLLKTQIKEKNTLVKTELQIFFSIKRALLSHHFGRTQLRIHGVSVRIVLGINFVCGHHVRPQNIVQVSLRSWKPWKVMEFKNFIFQAWKFTEFNRRSWKVMENENFVW